MEGFKSCCRSRARMSDMANHRKIPRNHRFSDHQHLVGTKSLHVASFPSQIHLLRHWQQCPKSGRTAVWHCQEENPYRKQLHWKAVQKWDKKAFWQEGSKCWYVLQLGYSTIREINQRFIFKMYFSKTCVEFHNFKGEPLVFYHRLHPAHGYSDDWTEACTSSLSFFHFCLLDACHWCISDFESVAILFASSSVLGTVFSSSSCITFILSICVYMLQFYLSAAILRPTTFLDVVGRAWKRNLAQGDTVWVDGGTREPLVKHAMKEIRGHYAINHVTLHG